MHGRTILQMEGREHSAHRRPLNPFFHGGGLEAFQATIDRTARRLAEPFLTREAAAVAAGERQRGEVDVVQEFTRMFPISVIVEMLDLPRADHDKFERWYVAIMDYLSNLSGAQEPVERGLAARAELAEYILPVIAERRGGDGDDLLSRFCRAEVDGDGLSDEEIRALVSLMLPAGGETTDRALANLLMNLLANPDQLDAVYADHDLVTDALAETLRCTPPVHMIMRQTVEDVEIQGVRIPAEATIACMLAAANRDPRKFAEPDRFDVFRSDNDTSRAFSAAADHLAFIDGRHFCVGAMLARTEVELGMGFLLDRMGEMRLREGFVPVEEGVFTRAPEHLEVTYVPS